MVGERATKQGPLIVILATGAVLGFFVWKTYVNYVPHLHPLDFKQGEWLVASDDGPQGYFRKELYISVTIKQAWLMVAATDSFMLYINGKVVDAEGYESVHVSGIYDIGHYLHAGKNVLGIVARRYSYPGPAKAAIEGAYHDQTGRAYPFATDASWKFSRLEQRQAEGEIPWHAELFDATSWVNARTAGRPQPSEVYPLDVHPLAFTMPPQGKWIGQAGSQADQATYSYMLTLRKRPEEAWMRIAAAKPYSLVINGVTVSSADMPKDSQLIRLARLQGDAIWQNSEAVSTDLYPITSLLQDGANRIAISAGKWLPSLPGLFVDGFVISNGEQLWFGSDATWTATSPSLLANNQSIKQPSATILADQNIAGASLPSKRAVTISLPVTYLAKLAGQFVLVVSLTAGLIFTIWKGTSRILHALQKAEPAAASSLDALAHLFVLLALVSLIVLSFDIRFDPAFPYQGQVIWLSLTTLLALKFLLVLEAWFPKRWHFLAPRSLLGRGQPPSAYAYVVILLGLTLGGAFLRLHNLDMQSLYHDEATMVAFVRGLFQKGYPSKMVGPIEIPLSTYELIPYPMTLSAKSLGFNDYALRLPAALFGIMTIPLLYFVGQQVFDRKVGLLAAAIYAFCPQALVWARYLWHPQQTQFFALLTSYLFYRAIRSAPMSPVYLYLTAISFILTYLSWEGAGFLLPALGLGLLVVKGKDYTWLRDKHLWIAVSMVSVAVAVQLIRRLLLQFFYLVIGTGLSDVSLPTLFFLDPMYNPTYYITNFLWLDNNAVLSLLLIAGFPFLFKQRGFSYYFTLLLSVPCMMTNLLNHAAIRYTYYIQPFLIISASFVSLHLLFHITSAADSIFLVTGMMLNRMVVVIAFIMITLWSSTFVKLYRMNNFPYPSGFSVRAEAYYSDYRLSAYYLGTHYHDGDLVVSVMPEVLNYYANIRSHHFIEPYVMRQVFYDPTEASQRYLEKMSGDPVSRNSDDLLDIMNGNRRTWIVAVPYSLFLFISGHDIADYINKYGKVAFESYDARVYLLQR